jgi:serine/threonine protein phosphatase PrpC
VERLVDLANDRGGDDNISVAMIRLGEPEEATGARAGEETPGIPASEGGSSA